MKVVVGTATKFEVVLEDEFLEKKWVVEAIFDDEIAVVVGNLFADGVDVGAGLMGCKITHLQPTDIDWSGFEHPFEAFGFGRVGIGAPGAEDEAGKVVGMAEEVAQQGGGIPACPGEVVEDEEDGPFGGEDAQESAEAVDGGASATVRGGFVGGTEDGEETRGAPAMGSETLAEFGAEATADVSEASGDLVPALQDEGLAWVAGTAEVQPAVFGGPVDGASGEGRFPGAGSAGEEGEAEMFAVGAERGAFGQVVEEFGAAVEGLLFGDEGGRHIDRARFGALDDLLDAVEAGAFPGVGVEHAEDEIDPFGGAARLEEGEILEVTVGGVEFIGGGVGEFVEWEFAVGAEARGV